MNKRTLLVVLVVALVASVAGNMAERAIYGPSASEKAYTAQLNAALKAGDHTTYQNLVDQGSVNGIDISGREALWSAGPFVVIVGGYLGFLWWARRHRPVTPSPSGRRYA